MMSQSGTGNKTMIRILCLLCCLTLLGGIQASAQQADTIYHGGPIITIDDRRPTAEAVGIKDGRIIAVGEDAAVSAHKGDATSSRVHGYAVANEACKVADGYSPKREW